jgi:nitroimidazol reductase NimA-like FMN-containing flavoprotein (pyridoxamine 5'-phosphate oxidase superfamily)
MTIAGSSSARLSLTRGECLELLTAGGPGRVAATMKAVPVIIPVTFVLLSDDVVFDPGPAPQVSRAIADQVIAFETDQVGPDGRAEWDVHVTGVARAVSDERQPSGFRLSSEIMAGWRAGP